MSPSRLFEGVTIALDSIRANKVRAFLTILGVAVGVMVVIAIASAITGINRGVQEQIETLGPKTFFVQKYFQGGLEINDGSEESQPWRRYPALTVAEVPVALRAIDERVDAAIDQLRSTDPATLGDFRGVGRSQLPSTVIGCLVHGAEHSMRHVGQLSVTSRVAKAGLR